MLRRLRRCPTCGSRFDIVSDIPGDRWAWCRKSPQHAFYPYTDAPAEKLCDRVMDLIRRLF